MVANKPQPKNWTTKTIIERFSRKVEEVIGENVLNPDSPARDETVGDVLDWLIQDDYGMSIDYTTTKAPKLTGFDSPESVVNG